MSIEEFEQWVGKIKIEREEDMMIRNIRLPNETIDKIKTAYSKGASTFWDGGIF
jgi:hypothetical protein